MTNQMAQAEVAHWAAHQSVAIPAGARQFLEAHGFLLPIVEAAERVVPGYLPGATMRYELFEDPEDGTTQMHRFPVVSAWFRVR